MGYIYKTLGAVRYEDYLPFRDPLVVNPILAERATVTPAVMRPLVTTQEEKIIASQEYLTEPERRVVPARDERGRPLPPTHAPKPVKTGESETVIPTFIETASATTNPFLKYGLLAVGAYILYDTFVKTSKQTRRKPGPGW